MNDNTDIHELAYLVCRGGWPKASLQERDIALDRAFDYYDAVTNVDIKRVDDVNRDSEKAKRIMRSYTRFQGGQVSVSKIVQDIRQTSLRK